MTPLVQDALDGHHAIREGVVDNVVPGSQAIAAVEQFGRTTTHLGKFKEPRHRGVERFLVLGGLFTAPVPDALLEQFQIVFLSKLIDDQRSFRSGHLVPVPPDRSPLATGPGDVPA